MPRKHRSPFSTTTVHGQTAIVDHRPVMAAASRRLREERSDYTGPRTPHWSENPLAMSASMAGYLLQNGGHSWTPTGRKK